MRILIIGSTGFIGAHLLSVATAHNIEVVTLSRSGEIKNGAVQAYPWSFGQPVPKSACVGISCAIHLAHDFDGAMGAQLTFDSTVAIAEQLHTAGIQRQLFFSSYSSGKHASSIYGQTKFAIEEALINKSGMIIIRPGLVLGEGGLYGRIRKWAKILPVVPLPDGGQGVVPVIKIEKLCELTLELALSPLPPGEVNLFEVDMKSLRQLVLEAAAESNRRPWILPIPAVWLIGLLQLASRLHLPLPVNADNLAGFMANQSANHTSTLNRE